MTLPPGPKRLTDDAERPRYHVAPGGPPARRPRAPIRLGRARRILVVRLDFVGDWIVTTPFLDELRRRAPRAAITAVVIDRAFAFADRDPAVDRVVSVAWARGRRLGIGASGPQAVAGFLRDYAGGRFDMALVPRWDTDFNGAAQIAYGSRAPRIVGFAERSTPARTIANRGDDRFFTDLVDDRIVLHEAARQMTLLRAFGMRDAQEGPVRASFNAADRARIAALVGRSFRRPILAVAPFVDQGRRTLPVHLLAPLVSGLRDVFGLDAAIVAAPIHEREAARFASDLGAGAVSLAGRLTLPQTAALMAESVLVLGMDSGPAHIAAGVGTPVIVFSCHPRTSPDIHPQAPARFAPRAPAGRVLVLQPSDPLPPCRDGCERPEAHCITRLEPSLTWPAVLAFADRCLGRLPGRDPTASEAVAGP